MRKVLFVLICTLIVLFACKKDPDPQPEGLKSIQAAEGFDWKTSRVVHLQLQIPQRSLLEITSPDGLIQYGKVFTVGNYQRKISLRKRFSSIALQYQGQTHVIDISTETDSIFFSLPSFKLLVKNVQVDTDNDGVEDADEDFPADGNRAFRSFFPADGDGRLVFEDLWPSMGDFDFNDLVLKYRWQSITNADGFLVELIGNFEILNEGAGMVNGFGFQFDKWASSSINYFSSITGVTGNALESNQICPTVVLYNLPANPGPGTSFQVVATLVPNSFYEWEISPEYWNPFLIRNGVRAHEIHLPFENPTKAADLSLFGTKDDAGDPLEWGWLSGNKMVAFSLSYMTKNSHLPWALDIGPEFDYPREKVSIDQAYNYFIDWATSGWDYQDWYLDLPGYRNSVNIED